MATVVFPSMTNQVALVVFEFLVQAELRKRQSAAFAFQYGCQEGIIASLGIFFGTSDDEKYEQAYDSNSTWLNVAETIVSEELEDWCITIEEVEDSNEIDINALKKDVKSAVERYALAHPQRLTSALKNSL